ncbi:hypothetical protein [Lysobacter sp. Root690]|uniref:hypothetical protein n=1 Tax=Lysobacter sp. Root690 TaxID=1736588 RepID=UPI000A91E124|nr:hypothetical protein [Lysobacter sp. Root690]
MLFFDTTHRGGVGFCDSDSRRIRASPRCNANKSRAGSPTLTIAPPPITQKRRAFHRGNACRFNRERNCALAQDNVSRSIAKKHRLVYFCANSRIFSPNAW